MPEDTTNYPAFTTKEDMLRTLWQELEPHTQNTYTLLKRISNTMLGGESPASTPPTSTTYGLSDWDYELPEVLLG